VPQLRGSSTLAMREPSQYTSAVYSRASGRPRHRPFGGQRRRFVRQRHGRVRDRGAYARRQDAFELLVPGTKPNHAGEEQRVWVSRHAMLEVFRHVLGQT
jgi:hypothetical protein